MSVSAIQVIQTQLIDHSRATNQKKGFFYILITILFVVHLKVNDGAIWIFSLIN